ncbi:MULTISPECIES: hypothetical protein [Mesorhizobium]|uniref:hypothetical protein n=1 Tax=Mesorhizobium TaxID=68287 RepID=UPI0010A96D8F|nr:MULTISPECIES: hypothetical protein [Mesorhizobium]
MTFKLPAHSAGIPEWVDILPTPRKAEPLPPIQASLKVATAAVSGIVVPETLDNLHPRVKAWLAQHKREQKEREQENKKRSRESWDWTRPLLDDLTERDLYRVLLRIPSTGASCRHRQHRSSGASRMDSPLHALRALIQLTMRCSQP